MYKMDIENNAKMKFSAQNLNKELVIKSELPEYDSFDESYLTEADNELKNLINGDIHEFSENETDSVQVSTKKLEKNDLVLVGAKKKTFACEVCFKTFETMFSLKLHMKIHLDGRFYKCEKCEKKFISTRFLNLHMRHHTETKLFECDICKKKVKYRHTLKMHILSHMEGGRPHKCSECSMAFTKVSYLNKHMLTHRGVRKFKCDVCKQAFTRNDSLKSHMYVHMKEKNFICNVCNKSFAKMTYLNEHKKTHMDKKPYVCNVCGKGFIYVFYLNIHQRTHTGERPFECDVCHKKFGRCYTMNRHKKRIHMKSRKTKKSCLSRVPERRKKSSNEKRNLQQAACDNIDNTSLHKKEEIIRNLESQKYIDTVTASENSISFAVKKEFCDSLGFISEIEFSDVKIEEE